MSLTGNASQGRINHLANTLVRLLQDQPGWGRGAIIVTAELLKQVRDIVRRNLSLLLGSTFVTAGFLTLLPSLIVTAVNLLGFTTAGVLNGSLAALIQGWMYGSQTTGLFSVLQAFGATAAVSPPVVIGIGVTLGVVGVGFFGYRLWTRYHAKRRIDQDGSNSNLLRKDSSSSSRQVIKSPRQQNVWDFLNLLSRK